MATSCATVSIPAIPPAIFLRAVNLAVARNAMFVPPHDSPALLYIRPVVFACGAHLALTPPRHFRLAVYVAPATAYHGVAGSAQDALVMESFDRAAPRGTGHAKIGGNYAPVVRWSEEAKASGFGMTLHLDSRTQSEIEEFSTSGFVGVRKGEGDQEFVLVVPDSGSIVESVTSDSVLALAKSKGWGVEKRSVSFISFLFNCLTIKVESGETMGSSFVSILTVRLECRFTSLNSDTSQRFSPSGRLRHLCRSSPLQEKALEINSYSIMEAQSQGHVHQN